MGFFSNLKQKSRIMILKTNYQEYLAPKVREISSRGLDTAYKEAVAGYLIEAAQGGVVETLDAHIKRGDMMVYHALNTLKSNLILSAAMCVVGLYIEIYARRNKYPEWDTEYWFMSDELHLKLRILGVWDELIVYHKAMGDPNYAKSEYPPTYAHLFSAAP